MKKIFALFVALLMLASLAVPTVVAEEAPVPDEVKAALYNWLVEVENWTGSLEYFEPLDITGDDSAQSYRIYHLYAGIADALDYMRVGKRIVVFSTIPNGVAAVNFENGEIRAICTLQEAYQAGFIDDEALDKIDNDGIDERRIRVYTCGDIDEDGQVNVSDILDLKDYIMTDLYPKISSIPSQDMIYDVDNSGYVDVADIVLLKSIIMAA